MAVGRGRPGCCWKQEADEGPSRPGFKNITQPSTDQNQSLFISPKQVQKLEATVSTIYVDLLQNTKIVKRTSITHFWSAQQCS